MLIYIIRNTSYVSFAEREYRNHVAWKDVVVSTICSIGLLFKYIMLMISLKLKL
jgi:hypothetical protein